MGNEFPSFSDIVQLIGRAIVGAPKDMRKDDVKSIEKKLEKFKELLQNTKEPEEIQEAFEKLDKAGQKVVEELYQRANTGGNQEQGQQE